MKATIQDAQPCSLICATCRKRMRHRCGDCLRMREEGHDLMDELNQQEERAWAAFCQREFTRMANWAGVYAVRKNPDPIVRINFS